METFDDDFESDEDGFLFGDSRPRWSDSSSVTFHHQNGFDSVPNNTSSFSDQANSAANQSQSFGKQENLGSFGRGRGRGFNSRSNANSAQTQPRRSGGFPSPSSGAPKGKKRFVIQFRF